MHRSRLFSPWPLHGPAARARSHPGCLGMCGHRGIDPSQPPFATDMVYQARHLRVADVVRRPASGANGHVPNAGMPPAQNEPFPSWLCLADLQYVDGLGELSGAPGAAAELPKDAPGLELGVRALAGCPEPCVGAVRFFLGWRLVLPDVRDLRVIASLVAFVRQGDQ